MRIARLEVQNFHVLEASSLGLDSATVIVGANDSGKSTLLGAVDWLFNWRHYEEDDHPFFTHHYRSSESGLVSGPESITVVAECEELGERRSTVFGPLLTEGRLRFGRLVRTDIPKFDQAAPWIVASPNAWRRLAEQTARTGDLRGQPRNQDADAVFAEYLPNCLDIDGDLWMPAEAVVDVFWFHPAPDIDDLPRSSDVIWLRGPEREVDPSDLIHPVLRERLKRELGDPHQRRRRSWQTHLENPIGALEASRGDQRAETKADEVIESADSAKMTALSAWQAAATRMLGRERRLEFRNDPYSRLEGIVDAAIGDLHPTIDGRAIELAGAGTRRALALAALELYREDDLWPADASIILMIEEPEVGLDANAQRRVSAALRELPGHSVQTIVVTHSPVLVNAADPSGIRIIRRAPDSEGVLGTPAIHTPYHLDEIANELGAKPSDVLLARRFLVTEGQSDSGILSMWALTLGFDFRLLGVRTVDAGGYASVHVVSRLIDIAYREPSIVVVLDNGSDTKKAQRDIEAKFGDRVEVHLLDTTEIEGQFRRPAIERWLERQGVILSEGIGADIDASLVNGVTKKSLRRLAERLLSRSYETLRDGIAIAAATTEAEVPPGVKSILLRIGDAG